MVDTLGDSKAAWRAADGHPSRCSISAGSQTIQPKGLCNAAPLAHRLATDPVRTAKPAVSRRPPASQASMNVSVSAIGPLSLQGPLEVSTLSPDHTSRRPEFDPSPCHKVFKRVPHLRATPQAGSRDLSAPIPRVRNRRFAIILGGAVSLTGFSGWLASLRRQSPHVPTGSTDPLRCLHSRVRLNRS